MFRKSICWKSIALLSNCFTRLLIKILQDICFLSSPLFDLNFLFLHFSSFSNFSLHRIISFIFSFVLFAPPFIEQYFGLSFFILFLFHSFFYHFQMKPKNVHKYLRSTFYFICFFRLSFSSPFSLHQIIVFISDRIKF
jgi:hypothetical protein